MDATCRLCGNPADVATTEGADGLCAACAKRAQRRRSIFDVSTTAAPEKPAAAPPGPEEPPAPRGEDLSALQEEMRLIDLRDLARRTQEGLAARAPVDDSEAPLLVHEAVMLVDSLAPASLGAATNDEETSPEARDPAPASTPFPTPAEAAQKRWRAAGSGAALLLVMGTLVAVKARLRDEAPSEALTPEQADPAAPASPERTGPVSTTQDPSSKEGASGAPSAIPPAKPTSTPASAPKRAPVSHPSPPPSRPRAPAPAAPADNRGAADPAAHIDLLDAMQAAVAKHSAPPGAPKRGCPPASGAAPGSPPCPRAAPRTSNLP